MPARHNPAARLAIRLALSAAIAGSLLTACGGDVANEADTRAEPARTPATVPDSVASRSRSQAQARERGINYDPVHSLEFARAVGTDDLQGMKDAIKADLDKLAELHRMGFPEIRSLKTFFTIYTSLGYSHPMVEVNIADIVHEWNQANPDHALTLALGVYEFRVGPDACTSAQQCAQWSATQVQGAVTAANAYPGLVRRIVVGNENLESGAAGQALVQRMVDDIRALKGGIHDKTIRIGTAQTSDGARQLISGQNHADLRAVLDFVGANIYPYWSGIAYGSPPYSDSLAKRSVTDYWRQMQAYANLPEIVMTEEGWPTAGFRNGDALPSPDAAHDYFHYWYYRPASEGFGASYHFALFDKLPGQDTESHWGVYSADRYASLMGTPANPDDVSKPLAPEHVLIHVRNQVKGRRVALLACTTDWTGANAAQACFPIYGYSGTGDIGAGASREFMLDTQGKTYRSLLAVYYDGANAPRLCYVDGATLAGLPERMRNQPALHLSLEWVNDRGDAPCGLKP